MVRKAFDVRQVRSASSSFPKWWRETCLKEDCPERRALPFQNGGEKKCLKKDCSERRALPFQSGGEKKCLKEDCPERRALPFQSGGEKKCLKEDCPERRALPFQSGGEKRVGRKTAQNGELFLSPRPFPWLRVDRLLFELNQQTDHHTLSLRRRQCLNKSSVSTAWLETPFCVTAHTMSRQV